MTSLLELRRAALEQSKDDGLNQAAKKPLQELVVIEQPQQQVEEQKNSLVLNLAQHLITMQEFELETSPRDTVYRLLSEKKLGEQFIFKTSLGGGIRYVQAMRMVLTRARGRAKASKRKLDEFKLYCLNITSIENSHDVVTLVRSKNMTEQEASIYDSLIEIFAKD